MRNLFVQIYGERRWRLWSPRQAQLMRVQGGIGYATAMGAHTQWSVRNPEAIGLNETYAAHMHAISSYTVNMRPGDVLYVPPWWFHDTRVHGGFSLGISARGQDWPGGSAWDLPVLRFLRFDDFSLNAMMLDLFYVLPMFADENRGRRAGFVEFRQHKS
ncbi:ppm2 [Symbiodinium sp. CCMP2456]|nr:ppm2 [Symbiodinium sp. CCMP2456]